MTISTTTNRVSFAGNGSTTAFATGFKFFANGDLVVTLVTDSTGAEVVKTITTHYSVTGAGVVTGGTVTMVTAPATGETLVIVRAQAYTQGLDLVENDPFPSESVEDQLDKNVIMAQQNDSALDRSLRQPAGDTADIDFLPPKVTRATKALGFDADGDPTVSTLTLAAIESGATDAAASAVTAASEATAAAASAAAAAASETAAGVSEAAAASYASPVTETFADTVGFTAGTSTTITLAATVVEDAVIITFDGVTQHHDTYSISGTTVTFTSTIPVGVLAIEASYGTRSTGAIDNIIIGANTPAAGSFTTVNGVTPATAQYTTTLDTKLGGIEALADVTDATNVTAAGALMDSELTDIAAVKALDQGVATTDSPTFVNVTATDLDGILGSNTPAAVNGTTLTASGNAIVDNLGTGGISPVRDLHVSNAGTNVFAQWTNNTTGHTTTDGWLSGMPNGTDFRYYGYEVGGVFTVYPEETLSLTVAKLGVTVAGTLSAGATTVTTLTASGDVAINTDTLLVDVSTETIGVKMTPDVLGAPLQIKHDGTVAYLGLDGGNSDTAPFLSTWQDPDPASALFGWSFFNRSTDGNLRLSRRNNSTTDTEVLTIARSDGAATFAGTLSAGATTVTTLTASGEIAGTSGVAISGGTANTSVDIALPNTNFLAWYNAAATGATTAYIQGSGGAITVNGSSLTFSGGNSDFLANNITTTGTLSAGATDVTTLAASGDVDLTSSSSGTDKELLVQNTSNTASSAAHLRLDVAGASAADPYIHWSINGVANIYAGIDNSDGDNFKIGESFTTPYVSFTPSTGNATFAGTLSAGATTVAGLTSSGHITVGAALGMRSSEADQLTYVSGGSSINDGANMLLYGQSHGTQAYDITFRGNVGVVLQYDESAAKWDFQAKTLQTTAGVYIGGSAAANLLDDYEEGTWTPAISGDGTAGTYTNGTTQATYTKIGRMVTVNFGIGSFSTATGGTGNLRITGLPFTKTAGQSPTGSVWFSSVNTGASVISLALVFSTAAGASATLNVNEVVDNAVVQLTPISGVGVSSQIHGSITYFV
jgi:hypothetical protein